MASWQWLTLPTWPQVISALAPTRVSAATASARRHNSGKGAAIMPARITPRMARMFSTMLGNWMPTMLSVGSSILRKRPAIAETMRSAWAKVRRRGAPSVKVLRFGASTSASASGRRCATRRKISSMVTRLPPCCVAAPAGSPRIVPRIIAARIPVWPAGATRSRADSRTARCAPDARHKSSAPPIAAAGRTAAPRKQPEISTRSSARTASTKSSRSRARSKAAIMASMAALLTPI